MRIRGSLSNSKTDQGDSRTFAISIVAKNHKPWFLVEAKSSGNKALSKHLYYYKEKLDVPFAFQLGFDLPYVDQDCFAREVPLILPAKTFLSQLI